MQNDISTSLFVLQNYSRILKATQILINIELVKKNNGTSTQMEYNANKKQEWFYVQYYTNSRKKRARQRSVHNNGSLGKKEENKTLNLFLCV